MTLETDVSGRPFEGGQRPQGAVFVIGCLCAVLVISWLSLVTQPAALLTSAWWPAAGVALGLGLSFPRRYVWVLAAAVVSLTLPLAMWAGRPVALAVALSVSAGIEMVVGTMILRGRKDVLPTLSTNRDIGRLLLAVVVAAVVYDLLSAGASLALGDPAGAWTRFVTAAPRHAAGMLMLAPLFMSHPRRPRQASGLEVAVQVAVTLAVSFLVFVVNISLPLAFLPFVPLVWAAMRLSTRLMLVEILAVAVIASIGSARGAGPFAFDRLSPETGSIVLQIFEVSMVIVFLALSLTVGQERATAQRLNASEELFRRVFEASVAGNLIVARDADGWTVRRHNLSATAALPGLLAGQTRLRVLLGEQASVAVSEKADRLVDGSAEMTVTTDAGRILHISMVPIASDGEDSVRALQFHDVTEASRARQLETAELERAAEVQRALLPWTLPTADGWQAAAKSVPAKHVGGDFYDLQMHGSDAVLSLGDVMGKGMGAGMLAAATRAALRSNSPELGPASVVRSTAEALNADLDRTSAFVTLTYLLVNLETGDYRFADAGHGLHFVVRDCGASVEHVASKDLPIGLGNAWRERCGTLGPGDAVLLVSDGVMDIWGGTVEELHEAVVRTARLHCGDAHALIDALCAGASIVRDIDDVTAVVLGREPLRAQVSETDSCDIAAPTGGRSETP